MEWFYQGKRRYGVKTVFHEAGSRGRSQYEWLDSRHSFSFAGYYNPERMGFGLLRVLNDDVISPGTGFGMHPHHDMEIISIPLRGALEHHDSMGEHSVIETGDVQVMSAGTGIAHSEMNHSTKDDGAFLQIWIHPDEYGLAPRYGQASYDLEGHRNSMVPIVSGDGSDGTLIIHQNAYLSLGLLDPGSTITHICQDPSHGTYIFLIEGHANAAGHVLGPRDALGILEYESFTLTALSKSFVLMIDVPMQQNS
jgi:redox-sensitive bicupin YhaK (pirin superfamily)